MEEVKPDVQAVADEVVEVVEAPEVVEVVEAAASEESQGVEITIEGESPPPPEDSAVLKDLRHRYRESEKQRREYEQKLKALEKPEATLGEEPTLEACDFDADAFKARYADWFVRKQGLEAKQRQEREAAESQAKAYQAKLDAYRQEAAELGEPNFAESEQVVVESFSAAQQTVIVNYFPTRATLVAAIGKSPATIKKLAAITDPIEFALAVKDLETKVKVTPRKAPPAPEARLAVNSGAGAKASDQQLAKLRDEADRTGDSSKVVAFMRQQRKR